MSKAKVRFTVLVLSVVLCFLLSDALPTASAQSPVWPSSTATRRLFTGSPSSVLTNTQTVGSNPPAPIETYAVPSECLSAEEAELVRLVNEYRNTSGLPSVPASKSLTLVAQWHVIDLTENNPDTGPCNTHSWSDQHPSLWSPVCFTADPANPSGMWDKPKEITNGAYTSNGYENGYRSGGQATASDAFTGWKNSPAHNAIILEQGVWSGYNWQAMGVGIYGHYAVSWFGDLSDPQGTVTPCPLRYLYLPLLLRNH